MFQKLNSIQQGAFRQGADRTQAVPAESRVVLKGVLKATVTCLALVLPLTGCATWAQSPIPPDAVTPAPQALVQAFANQTESWGRGSGIFWGPDGTWTAVNVTEKSIGMGKWYVTTASRVCFEGTWYWREDFGLESSETTSCRVFRRDADGQIWSSTKGLRGPWYPFSFEDLTPGNTISAAFEENAAFFLVDGR